MKSEASLWKTTRACDGDAEGRGETKERRDSHLGLNQNKSLQLVHTWQLCTRPYAELLVLFLANLYDNAER